MRTVSKQIVLFLGALSFSLSSELAYSQDLLSNTEIYSKCYSKISDHPVNTDSTDFKDVAGGRLNPTQACIKTLEKAMFNSSGPKRELTNKNDAISKAILRNFHQFHLSWFTSLHSSNTHDSVHAYIDNTEPGLFITDALFSNKHYKTITTSQVPLRGLRENSNPNTYVVNNLELTPIKINGSIQKTVQTVIGPLSSTAGHFDMNTTANRISLGPLIGIENAPSILAPLPEFVGRAALTERQLASNLYEGTSINLTKNFGGGILGSPSLFLNNAEQYNGLDGGLKLHRRWASNIFYDILCSSLPNLPDNNSAVKREHTFFTQQNSELPFRRSTTCLACHTTIDNLAHVARNVQVTRLTDLRYLNTFRDENPNINANLFYSVLNHIPKKPAIDITDVDTLYNKREPLGRVTYLNYDLKFIDKPVSGLQAYGEVLASENDIYVCAAKRYYHFLTGVDVPLSYIPIDKKSRQPLKKSDLFNHYHRQKVVNLGLKLKNHGSLKTLIADILNTKTFKHEIRLKLKESNMKVKNSSRRQFLKDVNNVALTAGMTYGLDNLFRILLQKNTAHATAAESYDYRYVNFLTSGGPPRWYFDQPLNPSNSSSEFIPGNFGTHLKNVSGVWKADHVALPVKFGATNVFMPPVWSLKSEASKTPFSSLLNQSIMVRGLNMEINSHPFNRERTVRPFNSSPSITGLVGQYAKRPISSIGHSGASTTSAFKSLDGSGSVQVARGNPIVSITSPFNKNEIVNYNDLDYSVQQALRAIDSYAKDNKMASYGNDETLKNSYDMFQRNLSAFSQSYASILVKYQTIVNAEVNGEFPGVTTGLSTHISNNAKEYQYSAARFFGPTDSLQSILSTATAPTIAQAFAFAEFALKENLTCSLSLELGDNFGNIKGLTLPHDQHYMGSITSTLFTSLYYKSLLGCLTEFKNALTNANIWNKTVIHMASEFSRTPRTDGSGSDHGFESGSTSIFSGMITKPGLIGNIYQTPPPAMASNYIGTWGHSAPSIKEGQHARKIINDDVVSTLCEMLAIPKIGTKGISFVKNTAGKVALINAPVARNVRRA